MAVLLKTDEPHIDAFAEAWLAVTEPCSGGTVRLHRVVRQINFYLKRNDKPGIPLGIIVRLARAGGYHVSGDRPQDVHGIAIRVASRV